MQPFKMIAHHAREDAAPREDTLVSTAAASLPASALASEAPCLSLAGDIQIPLQTCFNSMHTQILLSFLVHMNHVQSADRCNSFPTFLLLSRLNRRWNAMKQREKRSREALEQRKNIQKRTSDCCYTRHDDDGGGGRRREVQLESSLLQRAPTDLFS